MKLSVLMPVRDAAVTVEAAVESLVAQTYTDFELVVVDDGCCDDSIERVRRLVEPERLKVVEPGRVGLPLALAAGLQECRGELVARMDADDVCEPERFALQLAYLGEHPETAVLATRVETFAEGGVGEGYRLFDAWQNGLLTHEQMCLALFIESPLSHPSVVFRRRAILEIGGYRERPWPEDYDLWNRVVAAGLRMAKLEEVLVRGRDAPERTSRTEPRYLKDAMLQAKAHFLAAGPLPADREIVVWGAGVTGKRLARYLRLQGRRIHAFVDIDPRKMSRDVGGVPVGSAEELGPPRGRFLLAAVAARGARKLIRRRLAELDWREGEDYLCVA